MGIKQVFKVRLTTFSNIIIIIIIFITIMIKKQTKALQMREGSSSGQTGLTPGWGSPHLQLHHCLLMLRPPVGLLDLEWHTIGWATQRASTRPSAPLPLPHNQGSAGRMYRAQQAFTAGHPLCPPEA